jgi:hypothetical protein
MAKITYNTKQSAVINPAPKLNKGTAEDFNEIKDSVNALYDVSGNIIYRDNVHTVSNKKTLTALADNIMTVVDPAPDKSQSPLALGTGDLWVGNKMTPIRSGDSYVIRVTFKAEIANQNGWFDFKVDIDGNIGVIFSRVQTFPKGANVEQGFAITSYIFCRETFKINGGNFIINPSHTMKIWDKTIAIERIHAGR